ncbi:IPT/TIG domain-containing protein [Porphyromonadaceae bacterium KH3R12]|nr:IPT/TIG domain-containing protein [Porphyromonadaceae bacterium KH3R12]
MICFKNICLTGILFFIISLSACSDENNDIKPITLTKVTSVIDLNTAITEAALGDFIAIHGSGLDIHNIDSVLINDVKVDLLEVYTENDILYLKIPVKLAINVTDKIYIYNTAGYQEIPFKAISPALYLERMFNEYTKPGDTIMIYGDFFELYEIDSLNAVVDFNGKVSKVINSANNYLTAQVPEDVDKNIKVKVKGIKYDVEAFCPGRYYDNECMIMDFDDLMPSNPVNVVTDPNDKQRLSGNFLRIDNTSEYSGWWYIAEKSGVPFTDDMLNNYQDYVIKCEFRTANQFIDGKIKFFNYLFWDAAPMEWAPSNFIFQNFNRWETITLPFVVNRSTTYPENMYYNSFNMRLEIDPNIARNFAFDNIRIYKKGD